VRPAGLAAGGKYRTGHGFVVSEDNGVWGRAIKVPGLDALSQDQQAYIDISVSCGPAGNCAAGGDYTDRHGHEQGFVTQ